jgi:chitin synthase
MIEENMMNYIHNILNRTHSSKITYLVGIDADTIFDYNCTYELIKTIEQDDKIHGCVGYVDILPTMNFKSPFVLYQYAEYMFSQCLRRQTQSSITQKVSCLSGCNQILRISEETCGDDILKKFNYLPKEDENILNHIRSYASEDRNHVCLMLSNYPYVITKQTLKAISYTVVPTSFRVFMSQRRRWSLGANTNDMMLVYLPGINIFERISAAINVITYIFAPFIFVATIFFFKSIVNNPTLLLLYSTIPILIIGAYAISIPLFIFQVSFRKALYYILSYVLFVLFSGLVNLCIYFYSIFNMDIMKWGKTRSIVMIDESHNTLHRSDASYLSLEYDDTIYNNYIKVDNSQSIDSDKSRLTSTGDSVNNPNYKSIYTLLQYRITHLDGSEPPSPIVEDNRDAFLIDV